MTSDSWWWLTFVARAVPMALSLPKCAVCHADANDADDTLLRLTCCKKDCGEQTYHHDCVIKAVEKSIAPQDRQRMFFIKRLRHNMLKGKACPLGCGGKLCDSELVMQKSKREPSHPLPKPVGAQVTTPPKPPKPPKPAKPASKPKPMSPEKPKQQKQPLSDLIKRVVVAVPSKPAAIIEPCKPPKPTCQPEVKMTTSITNAWATKRFTATPFPQYVAPSTPSAPSAPPHVPVQRSKVPQKYNPVRSCRPTSVSVPQRIVHVNEEEHDEIMRMLLGDDYACPISVRMQNMVTALVGL